MAREGNGGLTALPTTRKQVPDTGSISLPGCRCVQGGYWHLSAAFSKWLRVAPSGGRLNLALNRISIAFCPELDRQVALVSPPLENRLKKPFLAVWPASICRLGFLAAAGCLADSLFQGN